MAHYAAFHLGLHSLARQKQSFGAAFHQGLHCLPRQKQSSEEEIQFQFEIITCDPSLYAMEHPKIIVSNQKEESTSA